MKRGIMSYEMRNGKNHQLLAITYSPLTTD